MPFQKGVPTRLGTTASEETRKKMSDSRKKVIERDGHNLVGTIPWNKGIPSGKGRKFSQEHKNRISESLKKNPPNKGWTYERWMKSFPKVFLTALRDALNGSHAPYNNHSWRKLRLKVYERDGFTCQECLRPCDDVSRISCHHIDFDRDNNDLLNLITLCGSCHGKTTQKPDEWIQYYQDKMLLKTREAKTSSDAERA